jgi:isochorismate hydrolase
MAVNLLHKLPKTYSINGIQYYTITNEKVNNMSDSKGLNDVNRINEANISNKKNMTLKEKLKEILTAFWTSEWESECEKIADEFAIGFAEWLLIIYNEDIIYDAYTKEELLEIYKKESNL